MQRNSTEYPGEFFSSHVLSKNNCPDVNVGPVYCTATYDTSQLQDRCLASNRLLTDWTFLAMLAKPLHGTFFVEMVLTRKNHNDLIWLIL